MSSQQTLAGEKGEFLFQWSKKLWKTKQEFGFQVLFLYLLSVGFSAFFFLFMAVNAVYYPTRKAILISLFHYFLVGMLITFLPAIVFLAVSFRRTRPMRFYRYGFEYPYHPYWDSSLIPTEFRWLLKLRGVFLRYEEITAIRELKLTERGWAQALELNLIIETARLFDLTISDRFKKETLELLKKAMGEEAFSAVHVIEAKH